MIEAGPNISEGIPMNALKYVIAGTLLLLPISLVGREPIVTPRGMDLVTNHEESVVQAQKCELVFLRDWAKSGTWGGDFVGAYVVKHDETIVFKTRAFKVSESEKFDSKGAELLNAAAALASLKTAGLCRD